MHSEINTAFVGDSLKHEPVDSTAVFKDCTPCSSFPVRSVPRNGGLSSSGCRCVEWGEVRRKETPPLVPRSARDLLPWRERSSEVRGRHSSTTPALPLFSSSSSHHCYEDRLGLQLVKYIPEKYKYNQWNIRCNLFKLIWIGLGSIIKVWSFYYTFYYTLLFRLLLRRIWVYTWLQWKRWKLFILFIMKSVSLN